MLPAAARFLTDRNRSPVAAVALPLLWLATCVQAADVEIFPGDSFETAVENLNPGDVLTVHAGTYVDSGRISIGVQGTEANPVVIRGAPGEQRPLITRAPSDPAQNTINIEGARYLTLRGLEISSNGGDGVNMDGNPSWITLEDLVIHDVSVGVNFRSSMHHITVRRSHIYDTYDTGEGMYVGCNNATCAVSDSLIEYNWIHDTLAAEQGDGIEIKRGSHSNIIRNNVIHDTNWPCILLYGSEGNPRNVVEGNAMWNCGEAGMQVAADTVIRNNLILDSPDEAFISQYHQGVSPGNLDIVHNTIVTGGACLRMSGWDGRQDITFANNAVYCSGSYSVGGLSGVAISGNVFAPAPGSFPSNGYSTGRSAADDFIDAAGLDAYPSSDSALLGAGDAPFTVPLDFNGTPRSGGIDAGAYAWNGPSNPGWTVAPGFKDDDMPAPALALAAEPTSVDYQGQTTLSWSASNASGCEASGAWSGMRPVDGVEDSGPLTSTASFTLRCANAAGATASETVAVTVAGAPPGPVPPGLTLTADDLSIATNDSTLLSWSSTDADSCTASGGWSGGKPVSGSESTGALSADQTYSLQCAGPGGSIDRSVTVTVVPDGGDGGGAAPADEVSGGSGAGSWWLTVVLGLAVSARRRHQGRLSRT